jgi:hypothetical protein
VSVAIVSTSINPEPSAYKAWAAQGDLIVAGDRNSPSALEHYVNDLGGRYLTLEDQARWPFSELLGWNCIQRRNAAVMQAYEDGYDYVATVDDDNHPTEDWIAQHVAHISGDLPADVAHVSGDRDWVDIGQFNSPPTRQRGTPFGAVRAHVVIKSPLPPVVVSTAQVLGDPDCDAVTRIVLTPTVRGVERNVVVSAFQYAAFNSQATVWKGEWSPLIACLPYVGRYDDIFASLIAKRIMRPHGVSFYAGEPAVTQIRNYHDYTTDLRQEYLGMELTPYVIRALEDIIITAFMSPVAAYRSISVALEGILPHDTIQFMRSWYTTWWGVHRGRAK